MKRTLIVLTISHLLAISLPVAIFAATVGRAVAAPALRFWGFAYTCDAMPTLTGWVTGCFWQTPW